MPTPTGAHKSRWCPLCQNREFARREADPAGWFCLECLHYDVDAGGSRGAGPLVALLALAAAVAASWALFPK